jgi:hypothetical protein
MIVIRRMVDRQRSYTGIFLPGEPAQIFPTTDYEHARILQIYKQDRPHEGIINDFTDLDAVASTTPAPEPSPKPSTGVKPKKRKAATRQPRRTRS